MDFGGRHDDVSESSYSVFVYFRGSPGDAARVRETLRAQIERVSAACGQAGRAGVRRDPAKPHLTWLEVYEPVPSASLDAVLACIEHEARSTGLAALAADGRHLEIFERLDA